MNTPHLHYGNKTYEEAIGDAADHARKHLGTLVHQGKDHAEAVIKRIYNEAPSDTIVKGDRLRFTNTENDAIKVHATREGRTLIEPMDIHPHALNQLCERVQIPRVFANHLMDQTNHDDPHWGPNWLAENLTNLYSHTDNNYLMRHHNNQLRGFLSDRYRRLDSRPLLETFVGAAQEAGAVPIEAYATDVKVAVKAIMPTVYEPVPNEVMAIGMNWSNSEYGAGAHNLEMFILRLWCTNYAIGSTCMRQIHLGRRLQDDIAYSEETYKLDTEATASAIRDVVTNSLGDNLINRMLGAVEEAYEEQVNPEEALKNLRKKLGKPLAKEVIGAYNSPDVVNLPPGNNRWRMSNAISWVAQSKDVDTKLDLMRLAGSTAGL
ncbi:hypothetical protein CMI37_02850 [Candidatus Pacearchaeota archaeon]|nr:hypothetical protein [Candidatus Pacearchaeota archaeon]